MADWFLKNINTKDLTRLLKRYYKMEIYDINLCFNNDKQNPHVWFMALCSKEQHSDVLSLAGNIYPDSIECNFGGKNMGQKAFKALKYSVYKRLNDNVMSHYRDYAVLDDYDSRVLKNKGNYAKRLNNQQQKNVRQYVQKTL